METSKAAAAAAKARREGILPLETLDLLLADDASFEDTLATLNRDPEAFSVKTPEDDSSWIEIPSRTSRSSSPSGEDGYFRYVNAIRRRYPMTREREYRLSKRMEFFKDRILGILRAQGFPDAALKDFLRSVGCPARGLNCDVSPRCGLLGKCPRGREGKVHECCLAYNTCRSLFVKGHLHLVVNFTRSYGNYGIPLMDLIQEGNTALIRAVEKYDWRRKVRFQTYATFWIRQAVERSISANIRIVRIPNYLQQKIRRLKRKGVFTGNGDRLSARDLAAAFDVPCDVAGRIMETTRADMSLDSILEEGGNTPSALEAASSEAANDLSTKEFEALKSRLGKALAELSRRERLILEHRFGLEGAAFKTFEELGEMLKVSREMARQIHIRALRKMKKIELAESLRSFI